MCIPGVKPVIVPVRQPSNKARIISINILRRLNFTDGKTAFSLQFVEPITFFKCCHRGYFGENECGFKTTFTFNLGLTYFIVDKTVFCYDLLSLFIMFLSGFWGFGTPFKHYQSSEQQF